MYTLNYENLETNLRAINEKSADIFQWVIDEFETTQAWVELTEAEFKELTNDAVLWCYKGENIFNDRRFKWDMTGNIKRFHVQQYRNDNAPIKGWMRRAMQKVHALAKYSQKDIERIAKAIRTSVEEV